MERFKTRLTLVTLFVQSTHRRAIEEIKDVTNCVRINGKQVQSIRFANDIALITESEYNILNTLSKIIHFIWK